MLGSVFGNKSLDKWPPWASLSLLLQAKFGDGCVLNIPGMAQHYKDTMETRGASCSLGWSVSPFLGGQFVAWMCILCLIQSVLCFSLIWLT